ncbi:hypothetical protein DRQ18_00650 [bacterium]|nr:MAG: hypothetical protein DRQ18_00650 [bacterium]
MPPRRFGKTWWSKLWIDALLELGRVYENRLPRGRRYAREGRVRIILIENGTVVAMVKGEYRPWYEVRISLKKFDEKIWKKVMMEIKKNRRMYSMLLRGEMPPDIDMVFQRFGVSLFPGNVNELMTRCDCPDHANPCKHIAATHYILADALDRDPFLLFELRGMKREVFLAPEKKRKRRRRVCSPERFLMQRGRFPEPSFDTLPHTPYTLIRLLGPPPFWKDREYFMEVFYEIYGNVREEVKEIEREK